MNDDLICFSDFSPTMVEAAALPSKQISDGEGWSFWRQCLGEEGKKREWIYGDYLPRPYVGKFDTKFSHYELRYARDKQYRLYHHGRLYDTLNDTLENQPRTITERLMAVQNKLQNVLDKYPAKGAGIGHDRIRGTYLPKEKRKYQD